MWEGIATGDAHQWGSSFSAENYNEEISDALKKTYAALVSNPGFQRAWAGEKDSAKQRRMTAAQAKAKVLGMLGSGVGEDVIAAYIGGTRIEPPITADEIVDWKKAGISDRIIRAAVSKGSGQ